MNVKLDYLHISLTILFILFISWQAIVKAQPGTQLKQELSCSIFAYLFLWVQSKKCHFEKEHRSPKLSNFL